MHELQVQFQSDLNSGNRSKDDNIFRVFPLLVPNISGNMLRKHK